jgi:hypothetical protein
MSLRKRSCHHQPFSLPWLLPDLKFYPINFLQSQLPTDHRLDLLVQITLIVRMALLLDHQAVLLEALFMNRLELETHMDPLAFHRLILQQIAFQHKSEHIVREERTQVATLVASAKSRYVELSIIDKAQE